jgi:hypothetical protein
MGIDTVNHRMTPRKGNSAVSIASLALVIVGLQRAFLMLSATAASQLYHQTPTLSRLLITGYNRWDSWYYIAIGMHGYTDFKEAAFWPFYPMVMRMVHLLTGASYMVSGVIVSLVCFVIALFFLGRLVHDMFDMRTCIITMVLYAFFPTSFYFDSTYTEGLFMALLTGAAYFAHKGHFMAAGVPSALATLTRNTGIVICVVLLGELIRIRQPGWKFWVLEWWKRVGSPILSLAFAPIMLLGYCFWLQYRYGNFFAFVQAEKIWNRTHMEPWNTIAKAFEFYLSPHPQMKTPGYHLFEITCLVFALYTLAIGLFLVDRSLSKWAWWLYAAAVVWIFCAAPALGRNPDYLMSVPRFILMLFPCFIFLARTIKTWFGAVVAVGICSCVLFVENAMFYAGLWIA